MGMNSNLERLKAEVALLSRKEAAELLAYIQRRVTYRCVIGWPLRDTILNKTRVPWRTWLSKYPELKIVLAYTARQIDGGRR